MMEPMVLVIFGRNKLAEFTHTKHILNESNFFWFSLSQLFSTILCFTRSVPRRKAVSVPALKVMYA